MAYVSITAGLSVPSPMSPVLCVNCVRKASPLSGQRNAMIRFSNSKLLLCLPQCLHTPHSAVPFLLDTDDSNVGIGAVLSQVQNGEERVIAY